MKRLLSFLAALLAGSSAQAATTLSAIPTTNSVQGSDIMLVTTDPGGVPHSRVITVANLQTSMELLDVASWHSTNTGPDLQFKTNSTVYYSLSGGTNFFVLPIRGTNPIFYGSIGDVSGWHSTNTGAALQHKTNATIYFAAQGGTNYFNMPVVITNQLLIANPAADVTLFQITSNGTNAFTVDTSDSAGGKLSLYNSVGTKGILLRTEETSYINGMDATKMLSIGTNTAIRTLDVHGMARVALLDTNQLLMTMADSTLTNSPLTGHDADYLKAAVSPTIEITGTNIDFSLGDKFHLTLTANTILSFSGHSSNFFASVYIGQDGGGPYDLTVPAPPSGSWDFLSGETAHPTSIDAPVLFFFGKYGDQWVTDWSGIPFQFSGYPVQTNSTVVGTNQIINFIEGSNITLLVTNNTSDGSTDIEISSSVSGGDYILNDLGVGTNTTFYASGVTAQGTNNVLQAIVSGGPEFWVATNGYTYFDSSTGIRYTTDGFVTVGDGSGNYSNVLTLANVPVRLGVGVDVPGHSIDTHGAIKSAYLTASRILVSSAAQTITNSAYAITDVALTNQSPLVAIGNAVIHTNAYYKQFTPAVANNDTNYVLDLGRGEQVILGRTVGTNMVNWVHATNMPVAGYSAYVAIRVETGPTNMHWSVPSAWRVAGTNATVSTFLLSSNTVYDFAVKATTNAQAKVVINFPVASDP